MARRRSLTSQLFRAARISDDLAAAASGNPQASRGGRRTSRLGARSAAPGSGGASGA